MYGYNNLISRRQLVENIHNKLDSYPDTILENKIRDILDQTPSLFEWISCEQRLPDKPGQYLTTFCFASGNDTETYHVGLDSFRGKKSWAKNSNRKVIAWAEIPMPFEPYDKGWEYVPNNESLIEFREASHEPLSSDIGLVLYETSAEEYLYGTVVCWHSCEKKLPDESKEYFVVYDATSGGDKNAYHISVDFFTENGLWKNSHDKNVIAWAKIPELDVRRFKHAD